MRGAFFEKSKRCDTNKRIKNARHERIGLKFEPINKVFQIMPEDDIIDAQPEHGYSLYDLVVLAEDGELDKIDSKTLEETSPHILSVFLERLDVDTQREILRRFDSEKASEIVSEMNPDASAELVSEMREHRAVSVLNEMEPDDAADIVRELEQEDRDRLLEGMEKSSPEGASDIRELLEYPEDAVGAIMNPHVATLPEHANVEEAIALIRSMRDEFENVYYLYVVNRQGELEGVLSMRALLLAPRGAAVRDIMRKNLIGLLAPTMDKEVAAHIMADTNFHTLPVVDTDGELLGIVTHDDVIDILREETTEDIQKMAGAGADEAVFDPILTSIKQRTPWLLLNMLTAFVASAVVGLFDKDIAILPILAVFMPIIAGLGGNTGAQTLAVTVRSIALGEVGMFDMWRVCERETLKGLFNGFALGAIGALISYITTSRADFSLVVWFAMLANMSLGGFMGSFIPFTMKRFGYDPASGSNVFMTGVTDTGGFFIFLGLGALFLI